MRALTREQRMIIESETTGLVRVFSDIPSDLLQVLNMDLIKVQHIRAEDERDASLYVYESSSGRKIVRLTVQNHTNAAGRNISVTTFASREMLPLIETNLRLNVNNKKH